ncbi:hypothetical protein SEA_BARSTEN_41 [Gordonia Phage Barsten]|uniref:Minor tail protein n=1 Tax=Gordonia Phage Barsten TaxID=2743907 RepID=A0A7G3VBZ2_9CAUD|nr:minor tail protein [Gordonia Phage Barsten]QKY78396.1 hypothetical protein SEA_BARSTEN_41 [Gordonia Phage Barsten]
MIPGVRHRATRRRSTGVITFDNVATAEGSATTTLNLTTGSNATIIVFVAGDITNAARVDGVAMTLIAKTSNAGMYYATGLSAGSHTVQTDRNGSTGHIVSALSYLGVTTVSGGTTNSGSGTSLSASAAGSGGIVVAGFDLASGSSDIANVTSNGVIRVRYRRTTGNCQVVADLNASPVTASNSYGSGWTSIGVRLT